MKFSSIFSLAIAALAGSASCEAWKGRSGGWGHGRYGKCLSKSDVKELSDAYARLIGAFKEEDTKYLSEDFVDYSQSINTFISDPTQAELVTFNKAAFIGAQLAQVERPTPLVVVGEPVVDCDRFAIIWTSTFGRTPMPVRGLTIVHAKKTKSGQLEMDRWDVEFNSLNWAINIGGSYCLPVPPEPRVVGNPTCGAANSRRDLFA